MFTDVLSRIDWDETTARIEAKTENDVRRALAKERCDVEDFMALISPAATPYLETMARLSRKYTEERFGKTISMFIPLYITNSCINHCVYCGFHASNPMKRVILTLDQCEDEYKAIKKLAPFENLLIVTGENPVKAGPDYLAGALDRAKKYFANLKIEVMPLKTEDYKMLTEHGLNGVICFQETYNRKNYNIYHPRGMKADFDWRCNGFDRMGQAGVHSIGMGGVEDRHHYDGLSPQVPPEALLEDQVQRELPPDEAGRERRVPAQLHYERPGTCPGNICDENLRPRCGHIILDKGTCPYQRQYGDSRSDYNERPEQDRPRRILHLSSVARAVPRK